MDSPALSLVPLTLAVLHVTHRLVFITLNYDSLEAFRCVCRCKWKFVSPERSTERNYFFRVFYLPHNNHRTVCKLRLAHTGYSHFPSSHFLTERITSPAKLSAFLFARLAIHRRGCELVNATKLQLAPRFRDESPAQSPLARYPSLKIAKKRWRRRENCTLAYLANPTATATTTSIRYERISTPSDFPRDTSPRKARQSCGPSVFAINSRTIGSSRSFYVARRVCTGNLHEFSTTIHHALAITSLPTVAGLLLRVDRRACSDADDLALIPADDRTRVVKSTGSRMQPQGK